MKRTNLKHYQKPGPNRTLEQFESCDLDEVKIAQTGGTYLKYKTDELVTEGKKRESRRYSTTQAFLEHRMQYENLDTSMSNISTNTGVGSYQVLNKKSDELVTEGKRESQRYSTTQPFFEYPIQHEKLDTSMRHTTANSGVGPYQVDLWTTEPCPSYTPCYNSQTVKSRSERSYTSLSSDHLKYYPFTVGKQSSITPDMDRTAIIPEPPRFSTSSDNMGFSYLSHCEGNSKHDFLESISPFAKHSMPQKMDESETHGPDIFLPLDAPKDFYPHSELLGETCYSGAQPNEAFQFPDYIHFPKETGHLENTRKQNNSLGHPEYVPSMVINSCIPYGGQEISNSVLSSDENSDEEDPRPCQIMQDYEYHPSIMAGKLHADSDTRRTSVFSRLSMDQNISCQHETLEQSSGLSLNQLLDILSKRREYSHIEDVSGKSIGGDYRGQHNGIAATGQFDQNRELLMRRLPVEPTEMNNDHQFASLFDLETENDVVAEYDFELPFYNFKRRNKTRKFEYRDDPNGGNCDGEGMTGNTKRRKLIRPSLDGDECQNVKAEAEVMSVGENSVQKEAKAVDGDDAICGQDQVLALVRRYGVKGEAEVDITIEKNLDCKDITNTNDKDDVIVGEVQVLPTGSKYEGKGVAKAESSGGRNSDHQDTNEANGENDVIDREVQLSLIGSSCGENRKVSDYKDANKANGDDDAIDREVKVLPIGSNYGVKGEAEEDISVERNSECKDSTKANDGDDVIIDRCVQVLPIDSEYEVKGKAEVELSVGRNSDYKETKKVDDKDDDIDNRNDMEGESVDHKNTIDVKSEDYIPLD
ncbi:hypothetical protein AXF42_Ash018745 [Apostasia shenzhenica]|uniref:Uncharacterized protein n=1 Tax=Apostasia shenzhenica TaxID=1088818 RepID=A0A2I0AJW9_9ASPA|nr:hypothetical protein AXF42_Ash018745 [Apostasia shenzhenica]